MLLMQHPYIDATTEVVNQMYPLCDQQLKIFCSSLREPTTAIIIRLMCIMLIANGNLAMSQNN